MSDRLSRQGSDPEPLFVQRVWVYLSCKQSIQSSIVPNKSDLVQAIGQLSGHPTSSAEGRPGLEADQRSKAGGSGDSPAGSS